MNKQQRLFRELAEKYLAGHASKEEVEALEQYYELFKNESGGLDGLSDDAMQLLEDRMFQRIMQRLSTAETRTVRLFYRRSLQVAAAAAVLLAVTTIWLISNRTTMPAQHAAVIRPGGNKAVLTMSNGKKVQLEDLQQGKVLYEEGVKISQEADGVLVYELGAGAAGEKTLYHTITTPNGGQFQINLPDGSKVWLNAGSSLTYAVNRPDAPREVELGGEAYFEVAKVYRGNSKERLPFRVKAGQELVEVLGTHFSINSYKKQQIRTALYEGSVRVFQIDPVSKKKQPESKLLKPGQELVLAESGWNTHEASVKRDLSWKNGLFVFDKESIQDVMNTLSRWYDVEVTYSGVITKELFSLEVSRSKNIQEILEILSLTNLVHFKIEGRTIMVSP